MPVLTTTAIGIGLAVAGAGVSLYGQSQEAGAQQSIIAAQQKEDQERKKAMELDALRRKREIVRQGIAARSVALATATNQGAGGPGGSAIPGAMGGIQGQTGVNLLGVNQNLQIGRQMFDYKNQESMGKIAYARAQQITGFGQGMTSLGGTLIKDMGAISRIGMYLGGAGAGGKPGDAG